MDEGLEYQPLCIFAEGTTTNGTALMNFKRGAFQAMKPVIPVVTEMSTIPGTFTCCYDVLPVLPLILISMCSFTFSHIKVRVLPPFSPNEYLLEKEGEPW